ncbi:MAG: CPBP family intramembrane metalloprotease [Bacteroidetes bacterium]|nr:CPBP family intramembrane metalloprotease [Bacteroidota bacterium]
MSPGIRRIFIDPELAALRAGWRIALFLAMTLVAIPVVTGPVMMLLKPVQGLPLPTIATIISYVMVTLTTWVALRFVDKRPFHSVGISFHRGWGKELGQGLLFGTGMMTLIFVIENAAGMVVIEFRGLTPEQIAPIVLNGLVLYTAVGYGEELLFRGYLFQSFAEGTNKIIATLSVSLLFAAAHAGNPNVSLFGLINVALAGIWLSAAYFKTKALWLPVGLHISWNFFQGVIFSYPVSGTTSDTTQFGTAVVSGPEWLTGGTFGPEGGALATLMLVLGTLLIIYWPWVRAAEGVWQYDQWKEDRKRSLLPAEPQPDAAQQ